MTEIANKIEIEGVESHAGAIVPRRELKKGEYIEAVGRRKTAVARVRITPAAKNTFTINGKTINTYFPTSVLQNKAKESLTKSNVDAKFSVSALVKGGGIVAQADAVRHGVARTLVNFEPELRKTLKKEGYLKRDPRMKERKKFGLKKARKSPQWSKR